MWCAAAYGNLQGYHRQAAVANTLLPSVHAVHIPTAANKDVSYEDLYGPPDEHKNIFLAWKKTDGACSAWAWQPAALDG
jgi:hypothetical protein